MAGRLTKTRERVAANAAPTRKDALTVTYKGKILLADDNCENSKALCLELLNSGYEVETVHDGASTTARTIDAHPDLLILDLGVPAIEGVNVLERLRSHPTTADTPIVVLCAEIDRKLEKRICAHRAVTVFPKGSDWGDVVRFVTRTLER